MIKVLLAALGTALVAAPIAAAQAVRVRVTAESGGPVLGAIVRLLDRNDSIVQRGLSNEGGRVLLKAPRGGEYRIRVDRIGYRGLQSGSMVVPDTGSVGLELVMPDQAVVLPEISVTGTTTCSTDPGRAPATAALWGEIRKALDATAISKRSGLTFTMTVWKRDLDSTMAIRSEESDTLQTTVPRPFHAIAASFLLERGYLIQGEGRTWSVFGPDEDVLLSDGFLATHCFGLATKEERGQRLVGLRFEPTPRRTVPEISGTLWVDARTSQLRYAEFRYVNLPQDLSDGGVRGRVEFARLPEGWWVVDKWFIRSARVVEIRALSQLLDQVPIRGQRLIVGYLEDGGAVLRVKGPQRVELGAP